jgi:hypothetical protein
MPKSKGKGRKQKGNGGGQMVRVQGPGGFRLDFPFPRLPSWIGTPNLRAGLAIYPRVNLDMPITPNDLGVAAGSLAQVIAIDPTLVTNFAARFGATFKEYCVVGVRFELRNSASTTLPSGFILSYIDEESNAAPTASSVNYPHAEVPLVASPSDGVMHTVSWVPRDYKDLQWTAIGVTTTSAYMKLFGSTLTGLQATTAAVVSYSGAIAVAFRGYI